MKRGRMAGFDAFRSPPLPPTGRQGDTLAPMRRLSAPVRLLGLLAAFACRAASADPDPKSLRDRLSSEDAAVRTTTAEEILERWEELPAATLEELDRLRADRDPEVAAAAKRIRALVLARRAVGPWLAERVGELPAAAESGSSGALLRWAGDHWLQGRASDAELERFLAAAWEAGGGCPAFTPDLIEFCQEVRAFARLYAGWLKAKDLPADRRIQVLSLLERAGNPAFAGEFLPFLDSGDDRERTAAIKGLGEIGTDDATERLTPFLEDADLYLRRAAIDALRRRGAKGTAAEIRKLVEDPSDTVALAAIRTLAEWEDRESLPTFERALDRWDLREAAACAIGRLGGRLPAEKRSAVFWNSSICASEMEAAMFGETLSARDRDMLLHVLVSGEPDRRKRAAEVLADLLAPEDLPRLRPIFDESPAHLRHLLRYAFDRLPREERARTWRELLTDDAKEVRVYAVAGLTDMGERSAAGEIAKLLHSSDAWTVSVTALCLQLLGAWERSGDLARLLSRTDSAGRRAAAALGDLDARETAPLLEPMALREAVIDREKAVLALIRWSTAKDEERLVAWLTDEDDGIQRAACVALIRLGRFDKAWAWILTYFQRDRPLTEELLLPLLESGREEAVQFALKLPAVSQSWDHTSCPWLRMMSAIRPETFRSLPKADQRDSLRRLRNMHERSDVAVRLMAGAALARLGALSRTELLRVLEDAEAEASEYADFSQYPHLYLDEVLNSLNWAREPESTARLWQPVTTAAQVVTREDLATVLKSIGLELGSSTEDLCARTAPGVRTTVAEILKRQLRGERVWVMDGKSLRLITTCEAAAWWRERLAK